MHHDRDRDSVSYRTRPHYHAFCPSHASDPCPGGDPAHLFDSLDHTRLYPCDEAPLSGSHGRSLSLAPSDSQAVAYEALHRTHSCRRRSDHSLSLAPSDSQVVACEALRRTHSCRRRSGCVVDLGRVSVAGRCRERSLSVYLCGWADHRLPGLSGAAGDL